VRADQLLLQRGIASSRSQAQRLIASGVRWHAGGDGHAGTPHAAWKAIGKNSDELPLDAVIELLDASEAKYVSRGGLKLEGALKASGVLVQGKTCLDVGQSTGGFTDCLLQHGASQVVGVDVGSGQLHPSLRVHPQVVALEHVNARELNATLLIANYSIYSTACGQFDDDDLKVDAVKSAGGPAPNDTTLMDPAPLAASQFDATQFDLIVGDLSFISQTLVLPALAPLLKPGGDLLFLVKPQFELQPGQVGKGGIVKDPALYKIVEQRIRDCCTGLGLHVVAWLDSPITGGDGNREFFIHAKS
jgi:23S rRNA (cytidine1920-2'-O)/16S rRNA (cytidine1409-2'-O)-methyltransferase